MRIRWNPVRVMEATDQLERRVAQIVKPLQRARAAAEEAKSIPNLPDYVKYRFEAFMQDVERMIGGAERTNYTWKDGKSQSSTYISEGMLQSRIGSIRREVPQDALAEARSQPPLLKTGM